jgi:putative DNA primase/helicase
MISQKTLLDAIGQIATCSLVSQHWNAGKRHDLALALAGTLLRAHWSLEDTEHFIITAATAARDNEIEDRRQAIRDTAEQLRKSEPATGIPRLSELLTNEVAERILRWLGIQNRSFDVDSGRATKPDDLIDWHDPRPLPDGLLPVPVLADALVPDALQSWLGDIADRMQVPIEFPATAAIVGLSSVVGNQVRIRPKRRDDWTVTPNLWGAVIGRPGVMKSPAIGEAMKPLYRLEQEFQTAHAVIIKQQEFEREVAQARKVALRDKLKKAAKDGGNLNSLREQFCEDEQRESRPRRFIVNDATVEKYGELLNENPRGLLIFRDELTGWLRSLDDERRFNDRAFFLEAWNGDGTYTYDRIGRGTLRIGSTTTSILGGIQPGPLESYFRNALGYGEGDDGLMQRFQVIVYPDITRDWKNVDRWPETEAKHRAFLIYKDLSELALQTLTAEPSDDGAPFLRLAVDAQELFDEWFAGLNRALRSGQFEHPALEAHFSKYKSLMPSLALIFHLCDMADGKQAGPVSLTATERAAAWCDFLMRHAERIYGLGLRSTAIHARTLAGHLKKGDLPDPFTARELYRKGWAGLGTAKAVEEPLGLLEDLGWLRGVQMPTDLGRPTVHYLINPRIGGRQQ